MRLADGPSRRRGRARRRLDGRAAARLIGCTSDAHEAAILPYGDDVAVRAAPPPSSTRASRASSRLSGVSHAGAGRAAAAPRPGLPGRAGRRGRPGARGPAQPLRGGQRLAGRLGVEGSVREGLTSCSSAWTGRASPGRDGRGDPSRRTAAARGPRCRRVRPRRRDGRGRPLGGERSGGSLDPAWPRCSSPTPRPVRRAGRRGGVAGGRLLRATVFAERRAAGGSCGGVADFADLKSPGRSGIRGAWRSWPRPRPGGRPGRRRGDAVRRARSCMTSAGWTSRPRSGTSRGRWAPPSGSGCGCTRTTPSGRWRGRGSWPARARRLRAPRAPGRLGLPPRPKGRPLSTRARDRARRRLPRDHLGPPAPAAPARRRPRRCWAPRWPAGRLDAEVVEALQAAVGQGGAPCAGRSRRAAASARSRCCGCWRAG